MADSPAPARLMSLDVFRGLTIAAMTIVNNPGDWGHIYAPLEHAEWNGWTPTDLIFPFFVFILGVSLTLSKRSLQSVPGIFKRAAVIFLCGFLLAYYVRFDLSRVRIPGVLARLALCSLFASLIYRQVLKAAEDARLQIVLAITAVILLTYWALMTFVPVPGGLAGDLSPSGNLGAWIDRTVIGTAHLWSSSKTWDPEGLLSTLPAIATALTGVAAGLVLNSTRSQVEKTAIFIGAGGVCVMLGVGWDQRFPINKSLWTSSYVLLSSGLAAILLAICYWMIDVQGRRRFLHPLVVMGMNPLALFVMSGFMVKTLLWIKVMGPAGKPIALYNWIYTHAFLPMGLWGPKNTSLAFALATLAVLYIPLEIMYRRRIFWRA
ncbi:MAG: heparan-alpha-glucosaminide N-acetyltransferase domain-containing protein [Acidobacteriota bacterium]